MATTRFHSLELKYLIRPWTNRRPAFLLPSRTFFRFDLLIFNRRANSDSPILAISALANSSKFELLLSSSSKCEFNALIANAISSDNRGDNFRHLMAIIFVRVLQEIPMCDATRCLPNLAIAVINPSNSAAAFGSAPNSMAAPLSMPRKNCSSQRLASLPLTCVAWMWRRRVGPVSK
jgi:hypothetical protein